MNKKTNYIPIGIFPHAGTIRRLDMEIHKLIEADYKVDLTDISSKTIRVSEPDNSTTHNIEIPDNYPFEGIILNGVHQNNNPSVLILNILTLIRPVNQNILVYSHPKPILVPKDHFMYEIFESVVKDSGSEIKNYNLYTLDISGNPHIMADGFSPEFINKYASNPAFDIVFMPDCGGAWYRLQDPDFQGFEPIFELIDNVLKIVKPNGKLVISKFIRAGLFEAVLAHYPTSKALQFDNFNDTILEISKN